MSSGNIAQQPLEVTAAERFDIPASGMMDFCKSDHLSPKNSGVKTTVPFYGALRMQHRLLGEHLLLLKFMSPHLFLAAYL